jgi:hypothetical protein
MNTAILANAGHDTPGPSRLWMGHKNIQHRSRYGFEREPDAWRAGDERVERSLRLHSGPAFVLGKAVFQSRFEHLFT